MITCAAWRGARGLERRVNPHTPRGACPMSDLGFALIVAGLLLISIIVGFRIVKPLSKHGLLVSVPSQGGREVDMRLGAIVLVLFGATLAWPETTETAEAAYSSSRFKTVIATAALSYPTRPI